MPHYARTRIPGATYFFFTIALLERRCLLIRQLDPLREAFRAVRTRRLFHIDAIAALPDHLHCMPLSPLRS